METVLLDTSVLSLLHPRKIHSSQRSLYEPHMQGQSLAVAFQTVAEMYQWAEQNRWGATNRAALDEFLKRFLVIPYDRDLAAAWAKVMTHGRHAGRRLESADGWIAATALRYGIPLLTQDLDLADLDLPGLTVVCHTPRRT
jgi:tRNA(fMet)-specific endonuclease VapC